ncbi:hypothetical protein O181_002747 [Austropuccinia psidii MF-1]|uniref:Uncharacterized protein n=1 Tax=Austropuccinia psidii MF-1 TaxID=1389203 RepID=A0A9Q3GE90_9BASI|nr:hypothetical protein [Austropuccinia psidii MF-1]
MDVSLRANLKRSGSMAITLLTIQVTCWQPRHGRERDLSSLLLNLGVDYCRDLESTISYDSLTAWCRRWPNLSLILTDIFLWLLTQRKVSAAMHRFAPLQSSNYGSIKSLLVE